ncbi:DMT family transporter [Nonomuraea sp. NPDC048881]|uniref:DMT family transporter n=1 Tax=unclassified Nonomuraea TaxID=2593643 RepID=UPI003318C686
MSRRGWVLFALMSVIWGIPYLLIKVAVGGVPVPVLVFARTAIGAALLLPLAIRGGQLAMVRRYWRPVFAFACLEILAPWWLLSDAERRLTSSTSGLLIAAAPILGVALARLSGGSERLGRARWIGLVIGLAGVAVLAGPHLGGGDAWAMGEVLLTALCYSIAPLVADRHLRDLPTIPLTAACLTLAALVYTPAAIWTWPSAMPSWQVLAALGGLGVVCTGLAFVVFVELIKEAGPSRALVSTYMNPAVAIVAGVLILDEPLTALIVVSFALILGGCVLATRAEEEPPAPAAGPPERAEELEVRS